MKYVYVLVSDENDYYLEECFISVLSLKKHNESAETILLIDDKTEKKFLKYKGIIQETFSKVIIRDFDESVSAKIRSRLLKMDMRRLVDGKFLYIDSDTVIVENLDELEKTDANLGMILDQHVKISEHYKYRRIYNNAKKMSYSAGYQDKHFNGGIIYANDTQAAYQYFDLWHQLYLETLQKGIDIDQTALNEANARMEGVITELEGKWNVQINCGLQYISHAKIIHYLGYQPLNKQNKYFNSLPFKLCDAKYFNEMRKYGNITPEIEEIIEDPKGAFKTVAIVPQDCVAYTLLFSNHMRILKFLYVKCGFFYQIFENLFGKLFSAIYGRT